MSLLCVTCGEPITLTDVGLIGIGGVCRNPFNPNQDDEGLHTAPPLVPSWVFVVPPEQPWETMLADDVEPGDLG